MAPFEYDPRIHTVDDLERYSRSILDPAYYDFAAGGSGDERTLAANTASFERYWLTPRILTGVAAADTRTRVFGGELRAPIFVAPLGGMRMLHPDGEMAVAAASAAAGIGLSLSAAASTTLEDVAAVPSLVKWFQLIRSRDRAITADLIKRAENAGYAAICLIVDTPGDSVRRRDVRNRFRRPATAPFANLAAYGKQDLGQTIIHGRSATLEDTGDAAAMTWSLVDWVRGTTRLPVVLKGVLHPADGERAVESGVDAIIVSNHGGRQLDGAPPAIDVLEPVVRAVGGRIPVLFDSGIRRASDIIVALALGADAVLLGRPVLWALAAGGEPVVRAYLDSVVTGLQNGLVSMGVRSCKDLDPGCVTRSSR